jgi:hypothetical protein
MSISNAYIIDFQSNGNSTSGYAPATTTSSSVTLPAGIETLMLLATATTHFRLSIGASTALTTDPALFVQQGPVVIKLPQPALAWTLSLITDATTSNVSWVRVMEA